MAAAEARAAWQRTANRCFVQEDAKRAPKLACCPSSSSTPQHDSGNDNAASEADHSSERDESSANFMPLNWNPKNSNLPSDTKWWLQLQPTYGCQKDFTYEPLNILKDELENKQIEHLVPSSELPGESLSDSPMDFDVKRYDDFSLESVSMVTTAFMRHDSVKMIGEKSVNNNLEWPLKHKVDTCDYFDRAEELMDWKHADQIISKKPKKDFSDIDLPWAGDNKCTPWWRISDKDELASMVAQKSLQHIENCDLPRPTQTVSVSSDPYPCLEGLDSKEIFSSSLGEKLHGGVCNPIAQHSSTSRSMDDKYWSSCEPRCLHDDKLHSARAYCPTSRCPSESKQAPESDPSRAQLLEALCHSQTRAREAEIAAQKAYNEKEHIIKLLFRQASHLFAYKQWLHILQLENLCLQLKINEHQISTLFPDLPWMPLKKRLSTKDRRRKGKAQQTYYICKNMVVFAVGLGLAGAGMLLGWTLGWLLPCF